VVEVFKYHVTKREESTTRPNSRVLTNIMATLPRGTEFRIESPSRHSGEGRGYKTKVGRGFLSVNKTVDVYRDMHSPVNGRKKNRNSRKKERRIVGVVLPTNEKPNVNLYEKAATRSYRFTLGGEDPQGGGIF